MPDVHTKFDLSVTNQKKLVTKFYSSYVVIPPLTKAITILTIHALKNIETKIFPVSINAEISFPQNIRYGSNVTLTNVQSAKVPTFTDLTITVLKSYSLDQRLSNFVVKWISHINTTWSFLAGIGVIMVPFLYKTYNKDKKIRKIKSSK